MENLMVVFTFFFFHQKYFFLGKFGPKIQNYQFMLKFGTDNNLNMHNSIVMFSFSVFDQKYPFLGKVGSKNYNC